MNIYLLDRNQETTNKNEKPELLHPSVPKKNIQITCFMIFKIKISFYTFRPSLSESKLDASKLEKRLEKKTNLKMREEEDILLLLIILMSGNI